MAKIKIEIDTEPTGGERILSVTVPNAPKILMVSSISIPQTLQDAFTRGVKLNIPGANISFTPSCGYGGGLNSAIDNSADLIATAGGNISYLAAVSHAQKPFLSLTGAVPADNISSSYYKGGVSLESWASNKDRITMLTGKGYRKDELGLFCNKNSAMHPNEAQDWRQQLGLPPADNSRIFFGGNDAAGNNSATFDFSTISAGVKALIVSADPFFQDNKDSLISAANKWIAGAPAGTRHVMYPLLDHRNIGGANPPHQNHSSFHGHDLGLAYSLLGQLAMIALIPGSPVTILRLPNIHI